MIIDVHTHIAYYKLFPESFLAQVVDDLAESLMPQFPGNGTNIKKAQLLKLAKTFLRDKDCKKLIKQMDKAEIEKSVLLIMDGGLKLGEAQYPIEEIFEHYYQVLKKYPGRFVVFGGVDPGRGTRGLELFKKGIYQYGFKGLKLYPPMGYRMSDERLDDYYKICEANHLPVLIHTGPSLPTLDNKFANPALILEVAGRYPNINFILAHSGFRIKDAPVQEALSLPNVYLDLSGFQTQFKTIDQNMIDALSPIFQIKFNHKILFGTDWPMFNMMSPTVNFVNMIKQLFAEVENDKADGSLENVLYKNALEALALN
jgi:predicted TIM-barrel fold metal-dependent hydrolase